MAEATPSLPRNNSSFYIAGATVTLALMRARQAVKDTLRRKGEKVSSFPASEITAMAKAYLAEHRELIVEARATVERWTLEGVFGSGHAITVLLKSLMNSAASWDLLPWPRTTFLKRSMFGYLTIDLLNSVSGMSISERLQPQPYTCKWLVAFIASPLTAGLLGQE
jgi:hypothetical protein